MAVNGAYEQFLKDRAPRWLRGEVADKWWTVLGGELDTMVDGAKEAMNQGFVEYCAPDAVPFHARSRLLEPVAWENVEALRVRTQDAWEFWEGLGTTTGIQDALRFYTGLEGLFLYPFNADNTTAAWADGASGGDNDDADTDNWSRHAIVIEQPHPWERPVVGPTLVVGPDLMVGLTMTENELSNIRRQYRKHRGAHMQGIMIYVILDATSAESVRDDHTVTTEVVLLPLHRVMVGYSAHGLVGTLVVGGEFT